MRPRHTFSGVALLAAALVLTSACARMVPPPAGKEAASGEELAKDLYSSNGDTVRSALYRLENRKDPAGRNAACKLLESDDDYIWFNAGLYLASIGDEKSIPYLIKGLKHPAWRSHAQVASYLQQLTGQKHARDQKKWIAWWKATHPGTTFSFEYEKITKQTRDLQESHQYLVNGVVDPVRISYSGSPIRLIGVKPADDKDTAAARLLLKTAAIMQWVSLEFDSGTELDAEGARRALVYWMQPGNEKLSRMSRRGLPPVPFTGKTLIQAHLLKSGLYQLDLTDVTDPRIRKVLEDAAR